MGTCENVTKLRHLSGLTQQEFGEIAHVSRAAVSQWEGGRAEPRMGAIEYLRIHFGLRKADLIEEGGMDNAYVTPMGRIAFREVVDIVLTDEERELVRLYRNANTQGRIAILAVARASSDGEVVRT